MVGRVASYPDVIAHHLAPQTKGLLGSTVLVVVGVAVIAAAAQIRVPLPFTPVPLSGQTFAVLLVGASVGSRLGLITGAAYLMLGASGLPIYSGGSSGVDHLVGATGGYLVGFAVAAYVAGRVAELGYDRRVDSALVGMTVASLLIYVFGASWLMISLGYDLPAAVQQGVLPFLIGDFIKVLLAAAALPAAWKLTRATVYGE